LSSSWLHQLSIARQTRSSRRLTSTTSFSSTASTAHSLKERPHLCVFPLVFPAIDHLTINCPQNKQIDVALNSALEHNALTKPNEKLSDEGKQLIGDLKDVIEQAKYLFLSKNEGNLLQEFIWETQHITASDTKLPGAPIDKDTAKQHGNEALEGLRTLGTLILSNGQFRKLRKLHWFLHFCYFRANQSRS
jgi:hypothetical protein